MTIKKSHFKISPQIRKKIVSSFIKGTSVAQLANRYQIHRKTIYYYLTKANVNIQGQKLRQKYRKIHQQMIEMYYYGESIAKISKHCKISKSTIYRWLKEANAKRKTKKEIIKGKIIKKKIIKKKIMNNFLKEDKEKINLGKNYEDYVYEEKKRKINKKVKRG